MIYNDTYSIPFYKVATFEFSRLTTTGLSNILDTSFYSMYNPLFTLVLGAARWNHHGDRLHDLPVGVLILAHVLPARLSLQHEDAGFGRVGVVRDGPEHTVDEDVLQVVPAETETLPN